MGEKKKKKLKTTEYTIFSVKPHHDSIFNSIISAPPLSPSRLFGTADLGRTDKYGRHHSTVGLCS